jgi:hypothetical protein
MPISPFRDFIVTCFDESKERVANLKSPLPFPKYKAPSKLFKYIKADASQKWFHKKKKLEVGQLLLHRTMPPISAPLCSLLATMTKNTHPIHSLTQFIADQEEEIVIAGPFVQAMSMAASERDLGYQVLYEEIIESSQINPVHPKDNLSALSYILEKNILNDQLMELKIQTFGVKGIDTERDLLDVKVPISMFGETQKPSSYETLCHKYIPQLKGRLTNQVMRKVILPI